MEGKTRTERTSRASDTRTTLALYVASPLGFAESTKSFMYEQLIPTITATGVQPIDPWNLPSDIERMRNELHRIRDLEARRVVWEELKQSLGERNAKAIRDANGMIAVLDGVDVDSGTAAEIGYAAALGKRIIGYRGDDRRTGEDPVSVVNLQVEYFIAKNGGVIVRTLQELERELAAWSKTED